MQKQPLIYAIVTGVCVIALTVIAVICYFRGDMSYFAVCLVVAAVFAVLAVRAAYEYFSGKKHKDKPKK